MAAVAHIDRDPSGKMSVLYKQSISLKAMQSLCLFLKKPLQLAILFIVFMSLNHPPAHATAVRDSEGRPIALEAARENRKEYIKQRIEKMLDGENVGPAPTAPAKTAFTPPRVPQMVPTAPKKLIVPKPTSRSQVRRTPSYSPTYQQLHRQRSEPVYTPVARRAPATPTYTPPPKTVPTPAPEPKAVALAPPPQLYIPAPSDVPSVGHVHNPAAVEFMTVPKAPPPRVEKLHAMDMPSSHTDMAEPLTAPPLSALPAPETTHSSAKPNPSALTFPQEDAFAMRSRDLYVGADAAEVFQQSVDEARSEPLRIQEQLAREAADEVIADMDKAHQEASSGVELSAHEPAAQLPSEGPQPFSDDIEVLRVSAGSGDGDVSPEQTPAPIEIAMTPDPTPTPQMSSETRDILEGLPEDITGIKKQRAERDVGIERTDPSIALPEEEVTSHDSLGMNMKLKKRTIDVDYELEKAYVALVGGNPEEAIRIYRDVLSNDPNNAMGLFGLATTYHRVGLLDEARPLYGKLLKIDPYNREALNNFLVLVGEEAPEQAITQMKRLQSANPDFSPIPAQIALVYKKMGDYPNAIRNMERAASLAPENLVYRYNLAILYDLAGDKREAAALYNQLLEARFRGQELPADIRDIQERLTFLVSNK